MEDDDGNIEFVGSNRANNADQRGEDVKLGRRKDGETKRLSREEGGKIYSNERKNERRRRQSSEKEAKSDVKRKEGLFPPSVDIR